MKSIILNQFFSSVHTLFFNSSKKRAACWQNVSKYSWWTHSIFTVVSRQVLACYPPFCHRPLLCQMIPLEAQWHGETNQARGEATCIMEWYKAQRSFSLCSEYGAKILHDGEALGPNRDNIVIPYLVYDILFKFYCTSREESWVGRRGECWLKRVCVMVLTILPLISRPVLIVDNALSHPRFRVFLQ